MAGLDPAVEGALIGGAVAMIGVGTSIWATARTLRASQDAAQVQRLWERRSSLYVDLLREMQGLRGSGRKLTDRDRRDEIGVEDLLRIRNSLATYDAPVWAYASDKITRNYFEAVVGLEWWARQLVGPPEPRVSDPSVLELAQQLDIPLIDIMAGPKLDVAVRATLILLRTNIRNELQQTSNAHAVARIHGPTVPGETEGT